MRLADYVINFLIENGINKSFMITGRGALFLNDAIAKNVNIEAIFPHHEQSAAFAACAASAYYRKLQAVIVSTGCASTNAITGVLSAWQDNLPVIFISGQNSLKETTRYTKKKLRTYGQQEADIVSLIEPITKYSIMIEDPLSIKYHLEKALSLATSLNQGPVWIDIPLDLQNYQINPESLDGFNLKEKLFKKNKKKYEDLCEKIYEAKRPIFLIGSGVANADAREILKNISINKNIPIVYSHSAVDVIPMDFINTIGSLGSQGCTRSGAFAVQNADTIIVLGSRLNSLTIGPDLEKFGRKAKLFVVDHDIFLKTAISIKYDFFLKADIKEFLTHFNSSNNRLLSVSNEWLKTCLQWKKSLNVNNFFKSTQKELDIYELANSVPDLMKSKGVFICDSGFVDVIIPTNAPFKEGQRCIRPVSQGAMGFALPAVIGIGKTSKNQILCIVGDGSIMFNLQELETIARYKINVKILIINNGMYAVIKRRQKQLFRNRIIGVDKTSGLTTPSFRKIASAFGLKYNFCTPKNYKNIIFNSKQNDFPEIFEIMGKIDQEYIEVGYARIPKRGFVRRPIEDQKPFLDREIFKKMMLIEDID
jgi:acetolactate synthase-1/2/3 large subunit